MIYADKPRRYSKRGKRWSHVFSPDLEEMKSYAQKHGLKRRDSRPFPHWDVTDTELELLPGIEIIPRTRIRTIMQKWINGRPKKKPPDHSGGF